MKHHPTLLVWLLFMAPLALPTRTAALTINAIFDTSITSDPNAAAIESTINSAIAVYENDFSDPITATIEFQEVTTGLGGSSTYYTTVNYSDYTSALLAHASSVDDAVALAYLPTGVSDNPVNNNSQISLKLPLARALGFSVSPPSGDPDSTISLNIGIMNITSVNPNPNYYSLFAVVSHEIDEGLAFGGGLNGLTNGEAAPTDSSVEPEDLFRYAPNGSRSWTTDPSATAYCCFDGTTAIAQFNQYDGGGDNTPNPVRADFADWYSYNGYFENIVRVQDAFGTPGAFPVLGVELRVLDAIGLTYASSYQAGPVWVNFNYTGSTQDGTIQYPYQTLGPAISAVSSGGTIAINANLQSSVYVYSSSFTVSKPMTIISVNGPSTIK